MMGKRVAALILSLILYILLISVFMSFAINVSKASSTGWSMEYPSLTGRGRSIIKTDDGGYAVAGESEGHFLLLKVNSFGELQWFKKYEVGSAYSIVQTSEG